MQADFGVRGSYEMAYITEALSVDSSDIRIRSADIDMRCSYVMIRFRPNHDTNVGYVVVFCVTVVVVVVVVVLGVVVVVVVDVGHVLWTQTMSCDNKACLVIKEHVLSSQVKPCDHNTYPVITYVLRP